MVELKDKIDNPNLSCCFPDLFPSRKALGLEPVTIRISRKWLNLLSSLFPYDAWDDWGHVEKDVFKLISVWLMTHVKDIFALHKEEEAQDGK